MSKTDSTVLMAGVVGMLKRNLEKLEEPKVLISEHDGEAEQIIYVDETFLNGYKEAIEDVVLYFTAWG